MRCKNIEEVKRFNNPTKLQRRAYLSRWLMELIERDADVESIVGSELHNLMYRVIVNYESMTSIAQETGTKSSILSDQLFGSHRSAYTMLRYWHSRV